MPAFECVMKNNKMTFFNPFDSMKYYIIIHANSELKRSAAFGNERDSVSPPNRERVDVGFGHGVVARVKQAPRLGRHWRRAHPVAVERLHGRIERPDPETIADVNIGIETVFSRLENANKKSLIHDHEKVSCV
jgi:hypothetical protein